MRKWFFGVLALVVLCTPALKAWQAAQTGQPPVPPLSRDFQPKPYALGPGDTIRLEFYNLLDSDADMKKTYLVEAAGTIQLKYVGGLTVTGLTTAQVGAAVEKALVEQKLYPPGQVQVTATVFEERLQSVTVQGHVVSPSEKQLRGAQMTVNRAITAAGGFSPTAGQEIELRRTVNGEVQVIKLSRERLEAGDDPPLMADDVINVLAGHVFFVNGQVNNPGQKTWAPNMTVLRAVALAGGLNAKGKYGHIMRPIKDAEGKFLRFQKVTGLKDGTPILADDQLFISSKWIGG